MKPKVRTRFWVEAAIASSSGFLAVVALFWQDWIEALTGLDPDQGNGSLEWSIVAGLALVCVSLFLAARAEWLRSRPAAAQA